MISEPAGRPPWSAVSVTSSAVTAPLHHCRLLLERGRPLPAPSVRRPQSPSRFPSTAEPATPVTPEPLKSPDAPASDALATTFAFTRCTVTSPPKSVRSVTCAPALAVGAALETAAAFDVTAPIVRIEPSAGYQTPVPKLEAIIGA